jgi:hypothetical protein
LHMTNCKDCLENTWYYRVAIEVANRVVVYSELVGEIELKPLIHGHSAWPVILTNVLFVPQLSHNLISITYLTKHHGYCATFDRDLVSFTRNNELLFEVDIKEEPGICERGQDPLFWFSSVHFWDLAYGFGLVALSTWPSFLCWYQKHP